MSLLRADSCANAQVPRRVSGFVLESERRGFGAARPNGAGKTTCFDMIVGLMTRDSGASSSRLGSPTAIPGARAWEYLPAAGKPFSAAW